MLKRLRLRKEEVKKEKGEGLMGSVDMDRYGEGLSLVLVCSRKGLIIMVKESSSRDAAKVEEVIGSINMGSHGEGLS